MGKYKLIALDMDGTVLDEEKKISDRNRRAILAAIEQGVTVMFATGRGIHRVRPYVEELGLKAPVVTVNGGEVWKTPQELLRRDPLGADEVIRLIELTKQYEGVWYWAYSVEGLYNRDRWVDDVSSVTWLKFGIYYENESALGRLREQAQSWGTLEISNSHPCNLEINPKGITKASGLRRVCELLGCDMSEVVAMGDSLNDISMICEAGLGVAMGNAQEEVRRAADVVTLSNTEDGVANAIEKYVLA
jgi:hypothetical protein